MSWSWPRLRTSRASLRCKRRAPHPYGTFKDRSRTRECLGATCGAWSGWTNWAYSSSGGWFAGVRLDLSNQKTTGLLDYYITTYNHQCLGTTSCEIDAGRVRCDPTVFPSFGYTRTSAGVRTSCLDRTTDANVLLEGKLTSTCAYLTGRKSSPSAGGGRTETQILFATHSALIDGTGER